MAGTKGQKKRVWSDEEKRSICAQTRIAPSAMIVIPSKGGVSHNPEISREALDRIGKLYDVEREIAGQSAELRKAAHQTMNSNAKTDDELRRLCTVPGIGPFTDDDPASESLTRGTVCSRFLTVYLLFESAASRGCYNSGLSFAT